MFQPQAGFREIIYLFKPVILSEVRRQPNEVESLP
jgi:hypothetical protein